jgi:hypothetical protein
LKLVGIDGGGAGVICGLNIPDNIFEISKSLIPVFLASATMFSAAWEIGSPFQYVFG